MRDPRLDEDDDHDHETPEPKREEEGVGPRSTLIETRTLLLGQSIDGEGFRRLVESVTLLESVDATKPINVLINTYGGRETHAFAFHDFIRVARAPIRCIASGVAGGVANLVLCAVPKERRFATPNTEFFLHQPASGSMGATSDLQVAAAELLAIRKRVLEVLALACGQSVERLERDTRRKLTLDAEQAVAYGLVSRLIRSREDLG